MLKKTTLFPFALSLCLASLAASLPLTAQAATVAANAPAQTSKQRLIVLTDVGADPDDTESLVRLMLYSNEIDIEGLIATTSVWMKGTVNPQSVREVIGAYGQVRDNLLLHDKDYPRASDLLSLVRQGLPVYGMAGVGEGKDSPGSDRIIQVLQEKDDRPVWVTAWGGTNTLAQALYKIKHTMSEAEAARLIAKLRVHTISDQDDTGTWIRTNFPDLFYIVSPGDYGASTWIAINSIIPGIDNTNISNKWLADNIQQGHGPLGAIYPDVGYGMEGDTPSFLSLIPNGLNDPEHPNSGGWGGRYELYKPEPYADAAGNMPGGVPYVPETRPIWTNASDDYAPPEKGEYNRAIHFGTKTFSGNKVSLWRWRDDFQNDFAARMAWTTKPFNEANHPPVVRLDVPEVLTVKSGQGFALSAKGTTDPDGDSLTYLWFQYPEVSTLKTVMKMSAEDIQSVWVEGATVTRPETAEFVVRVTDKGTPPLTRYKRVTVKILP